jgi:hypothetical protein
VGGGDEELWRFFLALTCFLEIPARVRGFYPGGVHMVRGVPRSSFAGYDGYVGTCVWRGGYLREVYHVVYWWKVLALAN